MREKPLKKWLPGLLILLLLAAVAGTLGWLFSLSYFQHADEATTFREVYDYFALGDRTAFLSRWSAWLNIENLAFVLGYALRGFSEQGLAAAFAVCNALCWIPALYLALCRPEGRGKNWYLAALFFFLYIPDLSAAAMGSYWCRYHRMPALALLLVLVLLQRALQRGMSRRDRLLCVFGGGAALLYLFITTADRALLLVFAVMPICLYFAVCWWQDRAKRWRVFAAAAGAAALLLGLKLVNLLWQRRAGAELFSFTGYGSYLNWADERAMLKGAAAYFKITADCWNAGIPAGQFASLSSLLRLIRLAAALTAGVLPFVLTARMLFKGADSVHPVDAIASLAVLCNAAVNVLGYNNAETWRYYSAAYFLLGVLLCRRLGVWVELRRLRPETAVSPRRMRWERTLIAAAFFCLALTSAELPKRGDSLERAAALYNSRYGWVAEYAESNGLANGIGSFYPSTMIDVYTEGASAVNGMFLVDGKLIEHFESPCVYGEGNALFDYLVCDYIAHPVNGFVEENVLAGYGLPVNITARDESLQVVSYDYDVRWLPRTAAGGGEVRLALPLGTSRLTWSGTGLREAELAVDCPGGAWEITRQGNSELALELRCASPAEAVITLTGGEAESVTWCMVRGACPLTEAVEDPAPGTYVVTLKGRDVRGAHLSAEAEGAELSAERFANGTERCAWYVTVPEGAGQVRISADRAGELTWEQTAEARESAIAAIFAS